MAIYFGNPKPAPAKIVERSDRFIMPCSLEREERSLVDLKRIADSILPLNHRLDDDYIVRRSNQVLAEFEDLYATTWDDFYQRFGKRLREDYELHRPDTADNG